MKLLLCLNKSYYTTDHKYYLRVGTTKRIASREELLRLFEANGSLHTNKSLKFCIYDHFEDLGEDVNG
jgi:predicted HTH transcriptional regulator